ncbi:MAG: hypothetical protein R2864_06745 [Syntrophotaleaceae bacterium]
MKALKIAEGIYDVRAATDWNVRDFHGYSTDDGSTYNAFLIIDEKITLIDTVKEEFTDQMMEKIASVIDPKKIVIISSHTEMDHSGACRVVHRIGKDTPVYCSKMGLKNLSALRHRSITAPWPMAKNCRWANAPCSFSKPAWFIGRTACSAISKG